MTSELTKEERRLIDEAVAAGKVTQIPRGQSAWQIVEGVHLSPSVHHAIRVKQLEVIERRKKVRVLHGEGKTVKQIASALKVRYGAVSKDLDEMGITDKVFGKKTVNGMTAKFSRTQEERRVKVRKLVREGKTKAEICRILKCGYTTVVSDCRHLKITPVDKRKQTGRAVRAEPRMMAGRGA